MPGRDVVIPATDGYPLAATVFGPAEPRGVAIVAPALAVSRTFYARFAEHLASRSYEAVTFDVRGVAGSKARDPRRFAGTMRDWGEKDLAGVLDWAHKRRPDLPIAVLGHSAGAQVAGLAPNRDRIAALAAIASGVGSWQHYPWPTRLRRVLDWHLLVPGVAFALGRLPGAVGLGQDVPASIAREWAHWARHRDYVLRDDGDARRAAYASMRIPLLGLSFEDDPYAPRAAVDHLLSFYAGARLTRRHVTRGEAGAPLGHFGFFRERTGAALWPLVDGWLDGALPRR